jgi:hypothetical protein
MRKKLPDLSEIYDKTNQSNNYLEFVIVDKFDREHEFWCYEGGFSSFIDTGKKYSHHPLEVIRLIYNDPQFNHLTLDEICSLVNKHGSHRACPTGTGWNYSTLGPIFKEPYLVDLQMNPEETIKNVAAHAGLSCLCCENMALEKPELDDEGRLVREYPDYRSNRTIFEENMSKQYEFFCLFSYTYRPVLAPFCKKCLCKARQKMNYNRNKRSPDIMNSWEFREVDALWGLIGVYKFLAKQPFQVGIP